MKIDGHCHCGFIRYEAEVDPEGVYVCHCTDCQAISGGTYRWAVTIPSEQFRLLAGEPKTYKKPTDMGTISHQVFCPECASPLYGKTEGKASLNLRLGTARQRAELRPRMEVWCGSAQDWARVEGETERLERQ